MVLAIHHRSLLQPARTLGNAEVMVLVLNFQDTLGQVLNPCNPVGCSPGDGKNHGGERVGLGIPQGYRSVSRWATILHGGSDGSCA